MTLYFSTAKDREALRRSFETAREKARQANELAVRAFPRPIDPVGGEVGALRTYSGRLVDASTEMLRRQ